MVQRERCTETGPIAVLLQRAKSFNLFLALILESQLHFQNQKNKQFAQNFRFWNIFHQQK